MSLHIVVNFRWAATAEPPAFVLQRATRLAKQAEALGATLCGLGGYELAFAFAHTERDEAIQFAARILALHETQPVAKAGIAAGELVPFLGGDGFVQLAWGEPVVHAAALARVAQAGELLVDGELPGIEDGTINAVPSGRELSFGGRLRPMFSIDLESPFVRDTILPSEEPPPSPVEPPPPPPAPEPAPRATGSYELVELAREALLRGDVDLLQDLIEQLRRSGGHEELVDRLAGVLAVGRGAKDEGLRILRRAAESETRQDRRAKAILAYAIGLASAGRAEEALLEALSALAVTRAHEDRGGEIACARFLSQLSYATGHGEAASAWEHVAQRSASGG